MSNGYWLPSSGENVAVVTQNNTYFLYVIQEPQEKKVHEGKEFKEILRWCIVFTAL